MVSSVISLPRVGKVIPAAATAMISTKVSNLALAHKKLKTFEKNTKADYEVIAEYGVPLAIGAAAGTLILLSPVSFVLTAPLLLATAIGVDLQYPTAIADLSTSVVSGLTYTFGTDNTNIADYAVTIGYIFSAYLAAFEMQNINYQNQATIEVRAALNNIDISNLIMTSLNNPNVLNLIQQLVTNSANLAVNQEITHANILEQITDVATSAVNQAITNANIPEHINNSIDGIAIYKLVTSQIIAVLGASVEAANV